MLIDRKRFLLVAVILPWLAGVARAQSVQPGDDFFAYANADWLAATRIPAGRERWTSRNEIDELTRRQIRKLLDDATSAAPGSLARKVADFRAAWNDTAAIEARGLAPLRPALDSIEQIHDQAGLARFLGHDLGADVDPLNWGIYESSRLLGLSVEPGLHGEKTNVAFLLQGGLGLPGRETYLDADSSKQLLRTRYRDYIAQLLHRAGFDRAADRAGAVLALEAAIAESHASPDESGNEGNVDNRWTRADFGRKAPGMDWPLFFDAAGLARQEEFVVWQPSAIQGVASLVGSRPLEAWKDYLRFHLLSRYAEVLPRAFAEAARAQQAAVTGQSGESARDDRTLQATQSAMSGAIGRLYAERHFPARQKARVQAIANNVIAAFARRVEDAGWMSPGSRVLALAKLKAVYFGIGYPDRWEDYSDLVVDSTDPVGNQRRVEARSYRHLLARLGRPVDRTEWWIAPQRVGAVLTFQENSYNFAAGLLQAPRFDSTASDAATYGAIGAIVGHEVSHFVDRLGMDYDTNGAKRRWWTAADSAGFQAAADKLVAQFSAYRPFSDLAVDGRLSQTENVADLAGLSAAFDAYRRTLGSRINDRKHVREKDREFFLGFARSWRSKSTDAGLRAQVTTDTHAPDSYRIATVRNLDAWYEAFDVKPGQRLYLDPAARVRVW